MWNRTPPASTSKPGRPTTRWNNRGTVACPPTDRALTGQQFLGFLSEVELALDPALQAANHVLTNPPLAGDVQHEGVLVRVEVLVRVADPDELQQGDLLSCRRVEV